MTAEDYLVSRKISAAGRFLHQMLGERLGLPSSGGPETDSPSISLTSSTTSATSTWPSAPSRERALALTTGDPGIAWSEHPQTGAKTRQRQAKGSQPTW
jgi:hypothetical protein